ncbi:MAG: carboxylesterase/lipase family protein [Acidimicrobiia bacterium]
MDSPVVKTSKGAVRGTVDEAVEVFKGVPYAGTTAGANRFRPPVPREAWDGELDATAYGASSPQGTGSAAAMPEELLSILGVLADAHEQGEDCLVLNVWTPRSGDGGARPVMVWLHGGGYTSGSGSSRVFRGARLAARGDVVVITLNHRLGPFGFLELAEVGGDAYADSGNVGILDIVAALQWVQQEIAAFGGDPGNVTIFGESGGGGKVSTLLGMPIARGLFHRAVVQSGPGLRSTELTDATATSRAVLEALGLDETRVDELQTVPAADLLAAAGKVTGGGIGFAGGSSRGFGPVLDGRSITAHPFDPVAPSGAADIPLLIGTNKDEAALFVVMMPGFDDMDDAAHENLLRAIAGERADALLAAYATTRPGSTPAERTVAAMTARFWAGSILQAERKAAASTAPTFMYLLTYETDVYGGRLKSPHALEIPFVFDMVDDSAFTGSWDGRQRLADAMSDAWIAFARSGDPNHPGLPTWPPYSAHDRSTMIFDRDCRVDVDPMAEERLAWEGAAVGTLAEPAVLGV